MPSLVIFCMIQNHYNVVLPSQLLQLLELVNYYFELLSPTVQSHASSALSLCRQVVHHS